MLKSLKKSWIVCNKKSYLPKCFDYKSKILKGCIIRKESLPFGHVQPYESIKIKAEPPNYDQVKNYVKSSFACRYSNLSKDITNIVNLLEKNHSDFALHDVGHINLGDNYRTILRIKYDGQPDSNVAFINIEEYQSTVRSKEEPIIGIVQILCLLCLCFIVIYLFVNRVADDLSNRRF